MDPLRDAFPELAAALTALDQAAPDSDEIEPAMTAVEAAKARYGDAYFLDFESMRATEAAQYQAVDRAIAAERFDTALRLLDLAQSLQGGAARGALRAYLEGDDELALAIGTHFSDALSARVADRLRRGDREHRILASWLSPAAAREAQSAEDDALTRAIALYRMVRRRLEGPHADVFESCAARLLNYVDLPGALELVQGLAFRNVVEHGAQGIADRLGAVHHAVANGGEATLRAAIAKMRPREAAATTRELDAAIARERQFAAASASCAPPVALPSRSAELSVALGTFVVESAVLRVGDPSRGPSAPALDARFEAANGTWRATAAIGEIAGQPARCRRLLAHHEDHPCSLSEPRWHHGGTISVDAAMAGVFDWYHYADDEPVDPAEARDGHPAWYSLCMRLCATASKPAGVLPFGVVGASGLGDGAYDVWLAYHPAAANPTTAVAVCIVFDP